MPSSYAASAAWYDKLYDAKDYVGECDALLRILREHGAVQGALLDVACGTGRHLEHLQHQFERCSGLDLCEELLAAAGARCPGVAFHQGDMRSFDLGDTYDVVTCLFSAIGHMTTTDDYAAAVTCFHRHLKSGGLLVIEPWLAPDRWKEHTVHMQTVDEPELKIARLSTSRAIVVRNGQPLSVFALNHLIATPDGVQHIVEDFEMALYTQEQQLDLLRAAGFDAEWVSPGLTGRGLLVGRKV